jgi:hypothetical protein
MYNSYIQPQTKGQPVPDSSTRHYYVHIECTKGDNQMTNQKPKSKNKENPAQPMDEPRRWK